MIATSGGIALETSIRTNRGDRPVHTLARGDLVLTPSGELIAVREVTSVSTTGARSRLLIPANAFMAGPSKPLRIARHKAVCVRIIEDLLVDLDPLAEDSTVERLYDEHDYFDVVLERRAILLADELPVESCGNGEPSGLGPVYNSGLNFDAVGDHLLMRAGLVGWWLDHTPPLDLHLVADGRRRAEHRWRCPSVLGAGRDD